MTLDDYYMGRDKTHAADLTPIIQANAAKTVVCLNAGLELFYTDNPGVSERRLNSGWRPPSINATTPGAALHSRHMTAEAGDLADEPDRVLALWSLRNKERLMKIGILGMERPESTPDWVHWQIVSVGSGVWVFWPSTEAYNTWKATGDPLMVG